MNQPDANRKILDSLRTKVCGRCRGKLSLERDIYGMYIECVQCGATWHQKDLAPPQAAVQSVPATQ